MASSLQLTSTVDIVSTGTGRSVTDGGLEVDDGRSVGVLLGLGNGSLDRIVVTVDEPFVAKNHSLVTVLNVENLPSVRLVSSLNVLSERDSSVTVNGDF